MLGPGARPAPREGAGPGPDQAIDWEAKLAAEGLGEVGEDPAKKALMGLEGKERSPERQKEITEALMIYWVHRDPQAHYDHKRMAKTGSQELGLGADEVDVTEVEAVGELVEAAELAFSQEVLKLKRENPRLAMRARSLASAAMENLMDDYSHIPDRILGDIADIAAARQMGY